MFIQELKQMLEASDTMTIELDVADEYGKSIRETTASMQALAKKYKCTTKLEKESGPGGGHPVFSFTGTEKNLRALFKEYNGGDEGSDEEFDEFFMNESYNGPYDSQAQEDSVIENTLSNIEDKLAHEARYKSYHVDKHERTVYWVTQETSPRESQIAADAIAHELAMQHIKDYKVKVVLRDLYRGDDDKTPWQVAYTDHFMPEVDDDDDEGDGGPGYQNKPMNRPLKKAPLKPGFKPLYDESDFEKYDPEDRHTRRIRRYNHELGGIEYVQPQGNDMPITAVWYTHVGIGSAPTTTKITDLNDYLMMDPYNPAKDGHVHENLEEAVGKRTGFVGPFKSEGAGITDANGKAVCTVNPSDKVGPARMNERKKIADIIAKALNDQL